MGVQLQTMVAEVSQVQTVPVHRFVAPVLHVVEHRRVVYASARSPFRTHESVVAVVEVVGERNVEEELLLLERVARLHTRLNLLVVGEVVLPLHVEHIRQTATVAVREVQRIQNRTDAERSALVLADVAADASQQRLTHVAQQSAVVFVGLRAVG